ncbi:MAG: chemotaxis protein CheA [Clostridia bacterium]|nr:chemotaxis protein CheA [Clostridia bacterium]
MSDFDNSNNSMLGVYLFETTEMLNQLDDILLDAEKNGVLSEENINEIFRIMHTIKGSSAMMEFNIIASVSHKLEDLFFVIRDNGLSQEHFEDLFDLVLRVSDFLKEEVEKIQTEQPLCEENDALVNEILDFLNLLKEDSGEAPAEKPAPAPAPAAEAPAPAEAAPAEAPAEEPAAEEAAPAEGEKIYFLYAQFDEGCQMENIRAYMLVNKLNAIGKVLQTSPASLDGNPDASAVIVEKGFYCKLSSAKPTEEIIATAKGSPCVATVSFTDSLGVDSAPEPVAAPKAAESEAPKAEASASAAPKANANANGNAKPAANAAPSGGGVKQNLINVDLDKLVALNDLVGEIVISESMVSGNPDLDGLHLESFEKAASQLRKLTNELQDISMSLRMVSIAPTFQKMKRIVRDMGKKLDKDVELILMGETTEVDKTIVDAIADPLMHVVRNSMDHGIEDRAERAKTDKNPKAQIILSAQNLGGDIIIACSDDGRGLNTEKLLSKAKEKGILTKAENEYTEKEIFNLLMAPGFSTKDAVTEFSGRGVGMDVVKKNIEKIGGTVTIESTFGAGMTVYFKIPLTLAIIDSMDIRIGQHIYTVPISNIRESFKPSADQPFTDPAGREMIMIRGACYPIIRVGNIFHIDGCVQNIEEGILMLVDTGERLACLFVDELIGKHQVVVKPMPQFITQLIGRDIGISGCTIMGDGSISLILDVPNILANY